MPAVSEISVEQKLTALYKLQVIDSKIDKLTKDQILKIEESIVKKRQSENQNPLEESDLEKKLDPSQLVKVKKDVGENMTNKINGMDPNSWNIKLIEDDYNSEHPTD